MKKNTCWFFGDSFTQCLALLGPGPYLDYLNKNAEDNKWTDLVSQKLNCNSKVIAKGGRSTQKTFMEAIKAFEQMNEGDWVFVGDSPLVRIEGVDFNTKKVTTYNNEQLIHNRFQIGSEFGDNHSIPITLHKSMTLLHYINDFIIPFENEWEEYWQENFISLSALFRKNKINFVYWSHRLWKEFTSIREETNESIIDDHWGIKGCEEFSSFLIESIEKNNYILLNKD